MGGDTLTPLGHSRLQPPSTPYTGPLPEALWQVLHVAWEGGGISVQSDFARTMAPYLGLAASMGWVSTISLDGRSFGGRWHVTFEGTMAYSSRGR